MNRLSDYEYDLPERLIAQTPASKRDSSRLMVVHRDIGKIEHKIFNMITEYITSRDILVLNDTKVIPARIFGSKYGGGANIEVLLNKRLDDDVWEVLAKPAKRISAGTIIEFDSGFYGEVRQQLSDGLFVMYFACVGGMEKKLKEKGQVPLPPYITNHSPDMPDRYQTVYASKAGASAAPTAGLHFTKGLLDDIPAKKVFVTLHTGFGTFAPVRSENIMEHKMHSEPYEVTAEALDDVAAARSQGGRVIAVGTTSVRLLESAQGPGKGETGIFIYPGYSFKKVDAMITNFHLPKSTLLMLVSAFAGIDLIKKAYKEAIEREYRFFSFGDAMMIL